MSFRRCPGFSLGLRASLTGPFFSFAILLALLTLPIGCGGDAEQPERQASSQASRNPPDESEEISKSPPGSEDPDAEEADLNSEDSTELSEGLSEGLSEDAASVGTALESTSQSKASSQAIGTSLSTSSQVQTGQMQTRSLNGNTRKGRASARTRSGRNSARDARGDSGARGELGKEEEPGEEGGVAPLSEDFTQWKPEDYFRAKKERHRGLLKAVQYAGQKPEWSASVKLAQTLVKLLETEELPKEIEPEQTKAEDDPQAKASSRNARGPRDRSPRGPEYEYEDEEGYGSASEYNAGRQNGGGRRRGKEEPPATEVEPQVAQAIIVALGNNETKLAGDTLEALLKGDQTAPLPFRQMVPSVAKAISFKPNPRRENFLFRLITQPKTVKIPTAEEETDSPRNRSPRNGPDRMAGGTYGGTEGGGYRRGRSRGRSNGPVDDLWVQEQVVFESGPQLSNALRTRLAKYLKNPKVSMETAQLLEPLLSEKDPRNLTAQVHLYANKETELQTRQKIESSLLEGSSRALDIALGLDIDVVESGSRGRSQGRGRGGRGGRRTGAYGAGNRGTGELMGGGFEGEEDGEYGGYAPRGSSPGRLASGRSSRPSSSRGSSSQGSGPSGSGSGRQSRRASAEQEQEAEDSRIAEQEKLKRETVAQHVSLAKALWTTEMATALSADILAEAKQDGAEENNPRASYRGRGRFETNPHRLAATIPLVETRALLADQFLQTVIEIKKKSDRDRNGGSIEFAKSPRDFSELFNGQTVDPALIVLAKTASHKRRARRKPKNRSGRSRSSRGNEREKDPVQEEWASTIEPMIKQLCEKFGPADSSQPGGSFQAVGSRGSNEVGPNEEESNEKGAKAGEAKKEKPNTDATALDSIPVRLHKDANVVAHHHVRWPSKIDPRFGDLGLAPLELHYVRIEGEGHLDRLIKAYQRQAGRSVKRKSNGEIWIDGFNSSDKMSIDIRIAASGTGGRNGGYGHGGQFGEGGRDPQRGRTANKKPDPVPVVIEILTISIADASKQSEATKKENGATKKKPGSSKS